MKGRAGLADAAAMIPRRPCHPSLQRASLAAPERYDDQGTDRDLRPRRRKPVEYHQRLAPIDDRDLPPGYEDLPHMVARRRRAAVNEAGRLVADPEERPPSAPGEDHYLPLVDQGLSEVKSRLDGLTEQLGQLAELNAATAQASRLVHRNEEPRHELAEVKERLDNLTHQLSQHAQMHVANAQASPVSLHGEERPRELVEVRDRLDSLTQQIDQLAQIQQVALPDPEDEEPPRELMEVTDRLDRLTQQLGQLAEMHAENARISRLERREEEPPRELLEVKDRLDSLTQQIGQLAQLHVANAQLSRLERREEEPPRELVEVKDRLDGLTQQIGQLAQLQAASAQTARPEPWNAEPPRELVEAISQIDRRLDQLIAEGRTAKTEMEQRVNAVDRAVADLHRVKPPAALTADPPPPLDQALIEIADRQRALDGYPPLASGSALVPAAASSSRCRARARRALRPRAAASSNQHPDRDAAAALRPRQAVDTLRDDLAEIGLILQEAMPRKAVRRSRPGAQSPSGRPDASRRGGRSGIDRRRARLAEVRDALRGLTPAENLIGVDQAVQQLSRRST